MEVILLIGFLVVVIAALLYINSKWQDAKLKRDVAFITKPGAGVIMNEKKPSALPYLFK